MPGRLIEGAVIRPSIKCYRALWVNKLPPSVLDETSCREWYNV
jgi:hypothetical protein